MTEKTNSIDTIGTNDDCRKRDWYDDCDINVYRDERCNDMIELTRDAFIEFAIKERYHSNLPLFNHNLRLYVKKMKEDFYINRNGFVFRGYSGEYLFITNSAIVDHASARTVDEYYYPVSKKLRYDINILDVVYVGRGDDITYPEEIVDVVINRLDGRNVNSENEQKAVEYLIKARDVLLEDRPIGHIHRQGIWGKQ